MIEKNKNLKEMNSFMAPISAKYFAAPKNNAELYYVLKSEEWNSSQEKFILGGGSNILCTRDLEFVLHPKFSSIDIVFEDDEMLRVRVGAGVNWNDFVMWSVDRNLWGIENLVYIPGNVGACPVQNIGAYGIEVSAVIHSVEYVSLPDAEKKIKFNNECDFSYRNSWFKKNRGKHIISYVYFDLKKNTNPILDYGLVKEKLEELKREKISSKDVADVIKKIRQSKLPELGEIGMAGSFFKNPVVDDDKFKFILEKFPEVKYFDVDNGKKIPAGWILEELGYRGYQKGNVGNYEKHALVVTHNGEGTGEEVYKHVQEIITKVKEVFDIDLEPEVIIL